MIAQTNLPVFPEPHKALQDDKQFNAVTLGPQNTFSIHEAPADFQLEAFDFSSDEKLLYMEWRSGRLETRDIESGKRTNQRKIVSTPLWEVHEQQSDKRLVAVTNDRTILVVDPHSGKILRQIHADKGKFNYDIHKILLAPDGSWLAYTTEDNGKVLDLRSEPPTLLADLKNGYDIALSPDASSLWVVNREMLFGFKTTSWERIGEAKLLDQVAGTMQPMLAVISGENGGIAFVPSQSGLLRYDLSTVAGTKVTGTPTYWVGADPGHNKVFVREFKASALYSSAGVVECRWQMRPAQDFKMSPSGRWLGYRNSGKVELWSTDKLMRDCVATAK